MIIKIKNLRVQTIIGVYDFEQTINRDLIINAIIETNNHQSLESDELADTIDYDHIVQNIKSIIKNNKFKLIEKLANEIMKSLSKDQRIVNCTLEIDKVGAVADVDSLSITLKYQKNG